MSVIVFVPGAPGNPPAAKSFPGADAAEHVPGGGLAVGPVGAALTVVESPGFVFETIDPGQAWPRSDPSHVMPPDVTLFESGAWVRADVTEPDGSITAVRPLG